MMCERHWKFALGRAELYEDGELTATLLLADNGAWYWEGSSIAWPSLDEAIRGIEEFSPTAWREYAASVTEIETLAALERAKRRKRGDDERRAIAKGAGA